MISKETIAQAVRTLVEAAKPTKVILFGLYEQGKRSPSLGKLRDLLHAIDPKLDAVLKAG